MSDLLIKMKELTMLNGISGQEKQITNYVKNNIISSVNKIEYDNLGSLIAYKGQNGPKIMLAGHMDEIGLMVTEITDNGFVKFQTIGGWLPTVMLAQLWQIHTNKGIIWGITGAKPPHSLSSNERNQAPNMKNLFLDIGVSTKEAAQQLGVTIGNMITPYLEFRTLGDENFILAKAIDNRVGVLIVTEVLHKLQNNPNQFIGAFTVQEEVGLRGAITSANKVKPDIAIAVDVCVANDVPGNQNSSISYLGKGPQISCYDHGLVAHTALREFVLKVARKNNIPFQEAAPEGGTTDAAAMHTRHIGAAALVISVPTRYIHSHASIVHQQDIIHTINLLTLLIEKLDQKQVQEILFS
ncbi:M42 family metallopeptidase ['Opuntia sp.' phytoplasma]|uniref:M42 family metallopeptidase n=1 Tax=Candidatus Phytoplasma asiaticum TaxID=2763338 RepID=A0AAX3B9H4_9MOLU|nr:MULTISPECIES: M42 family metallopeptidase [Phytoplasma]MDO8054202.1 M42 family metallopeptidase ['Opuntia sp.' phytoplasma]MDO8057948.1 M42 family metallopeptidase ['Opuntia sp.' phytoplasma]UQV27326.1 M42 family metallopeptidase ['Parthenium hysterophorus' phyllody phytoplasma]